MKNSYYKKLYFISGLYDFLLGISFLFFYKPIYALLNMSIPENPAYLTFSALIIATFGVLLFMISSKIEGSRRMVIYSILIKASYVLTVFYYYFSVGKDYVDFPFILFAIFDFIFALLFIESLRYIKS